MNTYNQSTVMGSEHTPAAKSFNCSSATEFLTNKTSKKEYRNNLRGWIKILNQVAESDSKVKGISDGVGHITFMSCDSIAQEILMKAENSEKLLLDGSDEDPTRVKLVENILEIIAKETPSELVKQEVDILTEKQNCQRQDKESPSAFCNRFNGKVARYANQTGNITKSSSRQFAVMMSRNGRLTADSINSVMFQLTSKVENNITKDREVFFYVIPS